ncbi:MAG TPA: hypothetical protein VHR36_12585 [Pyrinomonadaceae bacterium]|nr:hypothetical protein [Pyrinomonadaceae bacterium]
MTICPCCGFKSETELSDGCAACGACPVGEALPKPEHELPSYGRSLVLSVMGSLLVLVFLTQTFVALGQFSARGAKSTLAYLSMIPFDFWSWVAAGETAAWRLKWLAIPVTLFVLWFGRKLYRSIVASPERFCGVRYARSGFIASLAVPAVILILIGITVPTRLEYRQLGIEAGLNAQARRIDRALDEYRATFGTLPDNISDLNQLPDPDHSLATALSSLDVSGYRPSAELAAVPKKPQKLNGAAIRNASISGGDDAITERLSFTNYELPLPGADKVLGTEDDLILRDGIVDKASGAPRRLGSTTVTNKALKQ